MPYVAECVRPQRTLSMRTLAAGPIFAQAGLLHFTPTDKSNRHKKSPQRSSRFSVKDVFRTFRTGALSYPL